MAAVPVNVFRGNDVLGARDEADIVTAQANYLPLPNHPGFEGLMLRVGALQADRAARRFIRTWNLGAGELHEADQLSGYGERGYYEFYDEDSLVETAGRVPDRHEWKLLPCVRASPTAAQNTGRFLFDLTPATPAEVGGVSDLLRFEMDGGGSRGDVFAVADVRMVYRAASLTATILLGEKISPRKEPIALSTQRWIRQKTQQLDDAYYTRSTAELTVGAVTKLLTWEVTDYAHLARSVQPSTKETGLRLIREGLQIAGLLWRRLLGDLPSFITDYYQRIVELLTLLKSYVSDNIESVSEVMVSKLIAHDMLTFKLGLSTLASTPIAERLSELTTSNQGWDGAPATEQSRRSKLWAQHHDTREQASQMQTDQEAMVVRLVEERTQQLKRQIASLTAGGAKRLRGRQGDEETSPRDKSAADTAEKLGAWTKGPKSAAKPDPPKLAGEYIVNDRRCKKGRCKLDKKFLLHGEAGDAKRAQVIFTNKLARQIFPGPEYAKYYAVRKWQLERNPALVNDYVSYIEAE